MFRGKGESQGGQQLVIVLKKRNLLADIGKREDRLVIDGNKVGLEELPAQCGLGHSAECLMNIDKEGALHTSAVVNSTANGMGVIQVTQENSNFLNTNPWTVVHIQPLSLLSLGREVWILGGSTCLLEGLGIR